MSCRYGSEEFAFLMMDASADAACSRAEELRAAIKKVAWCHNSKLGASLTFSAGVAASLAMRSTRLDCYERLTLRSGKLCLAAASGPASTGSRGLISG
jgi:GGDEF domain-containing protein